LHYNAEDLYYLAPLCLRNGPSPCISYILPRIYYF